MSRHASHFFSPLIWIPAVAGAAAGVLYASATAREVMSEALKTLFVFFTTPFILEATCAVVFFCALLAYNHWRLTKEGDGWVYLPDPKEKKTSPSASEKTAAAEHDDSKRI